MAATLLELVKELAVEIHPAQPGAQPVMLDSVLDRDIGLDSLARMELLGRVEREFELTLPERVFAEAETPRDLLRAVLGADRGRVSIDVSEITPIGSVGLDDYPQTAQTLVEVLAWHVRVHPDRPHIHFYSDHHEGEVLTYGELWRSGQSVASGLRNLGQELGETVVIMLPTGRDYFSAFMGILLAGGVPVPIYPPVRLSRLEDHLFRHQAILDNCAASTLVTLPEAKRSARLLKSRVMTLRNVVTVEELAATSGSDFLPAVRGRDLALIQYTSGSTGNPKGVVLTHSNLLSNIRTMGSALEASAADVFVSWLPLYHDMGLIGAWMGSLHFAFPLVLMAPLAFMARPKRWLSAIHRFRGTLSAAPNFAYELCLRRIAEKDCQGLDLTSWRVALNGAEPVSADTLNRFCKRFEPCGFRRQALMPVYGMAECSVGLAFPPLGRGPIIDEVRRDLFLRTGRAEPALTPERVPLHFAASGRPLPAHEIRVVNRAGGELPERQEGRLQFRGPSACGGYFRNPEQTRRLFHGDWLESGDLAYIANGDVFITGRSKDIIIRAGRNLFPQELEDAVGAIPGIHQGFVAVFGSHNVDTGTDRLVVMAETRTQDAADREKLRAEIMALCTDLVGTPPDDVVLAPPRAVLKTSSGKIRRAACRALYERGEIGKPQKLAMWRVVSFALSGLLQRGRRALHYLSAGFYGLACLTLFGLLAPFLWVAVVLLPVSSLRWRVMRRAGRALAGALRIPLEVRGLEHLSKKTPSVLVSNHASYLDSYVLVTVLPLEIRFVAKKELGNISFFRLFLSRLRTEYVERFDLEKGIQDFRRIGAKAQMSQPLLFFAEGTFTRMPGLLPFHLGAFMAAAEAGLPVIPVAIRGTRSILRADSWLPRRGAVRVTIGESIDTRRIMKETPGDSWSAAIKLRDAARAHILRYCGEPDLTHERSPLLPPPTVSGHGR